MLNSLWHTLFAPGFFSSSAVWRALSMSAAVAVVSGMVGVFAVVRGQSFAGHALGDFGTTGASGAFLAGLNAVWGFLGVGLIAGAIMDTLGKRAKERDIATGVVLSLILGIGALFLYFDTTYRNTTGAPMTILFGSVFLVDPSLLPFVLCFDGLAVLLLFIIYRPLLFSSLNVDLARAKGVPARLISILFMSALAMAVEQSAIVVGALLSTALLIGPAAIAIRFTHRPGKAMLVASMIGIFSSWMGILLAYDSYNWPPVNRGWPVSFFIASIILLLYLLSHLRLRMGTRCGKKVLQEG